MPFLTNGGHIVKLTMVVCAWLCAMALIVTANPAHAQNQVSYVSNTGIDSNGCTNPTTDACASFNHALSQTANYGEIDCANAGNYGGNFTISISVTIDCSGAVGSTLGNITISGDGIVVRLRNLSINGAGTGAPAGITGSNMAALYVEHCVITNFTGSGTGISFQPQSGTSYLFVTDSVISETGNNGGISITPGAAGAEVTIARSDIERNVYGVNAQNTGAGTIRATISDSIISGSTQAGIQVGNGSAQITWLLIDQSRVSGNLNGLVTSGSGAEILARNTTVFDNTTGLITVDDGTIYSYGTNSLNGNATNGAFTGTIAMH
jgi:hypothetical protein